MAWTKRDLIRTAYEEIGIPSNAISADLYSRGLRRLDSMMGSWHGEGIYVGYAFAHSPGESDIDTDMEIPVFAIPAIWQNLAVTLGGQIGKAALPDLKKDANTSLKNLRARVFDIPERAYPNRLPIGSGNKPITGRVREYFNEPVQTPPDVEGQPMEEL